MKPTKWSWQTKVPKLRTYKYTQKSCDMWLETIWPRITRVHINHTTSIFWLHFFQVFFICGKYKHIFLALLPGRCWTEDIFFSGYWRCLGQAWYLALSISTRTATWGDEFPSGLKVSILFWVLQRLLGCWMYSSDMVIGRNGRKARGCLLQRKCVRFTFLALHRIVHHTPNTNMQYC